ncbi:MAG: prepilin peptidase [Gammaproteobacteria bacterium]|nr:prepilin peptidase [Gammaproteobacteria bacterium]
MFSALQANIGLLLFAAIVVGLVVGSFLNVVMHRLPIMMMLEWRETAEDYQKNPPQNLPANISEKTFNLMTPRSRCPHCGHAISAWENIPVISFLLLRGRCVQCKTPISWQYPIIECVSAILAAIAVWQFDFTILALWAAVLSWALLALTVIDFKTYYLPDKITLPFIWLGLLINLQNGFVSLSAAVIGATAGYLSLWLFYHLFKSITGKEGMGYGDFKLFAMLGAWLGWQALPGIIVLSAVVGSIVGLSLIIFFKRDRHHAIPFGPYLAGAGWIYLLWGTAINQSYWRWLQPL